MLRDAPVLSSDHVCLPNHIQQAGFAVVDMAEHGDHGWTGKKVLALSAGELFLEFVEPGLGGDNRQINAEVQGKQLGRLRR